MFFIFSTFANRFSTLFPQDLASAAKSAVLHGFGSGTGAPGAGDGAPPRVAPGEVFSSPRSGASEASWGLR